MKITVVALAKCPSCLGHGEVQHRCHDKIRGTDCPTHDYCYVYFEGLVHPPDLVTVSALADLSVSDSYVDADGKCNEIVRVENYGSDGYLEFQNGCRANLAKHHRVRVLK